ncbi:MAG: aldo/keto reductase [Chloroflexota bacterium]|nr:MAG: aldo/keto reductase [Chloroflexota bacterium]
MMEYRPLGKTGVQVSRYCLGTAFLGSQTPLDRSIEIVHRACDLGINFIDTANTYGDRRFKGDRPGYPDIWPAVEEVVGRAIADRRDRVIVATKVCEPVGDGPNDRGLSRHFIMRQVEISLRRLGTDYIDVYYAHHPDPRTPIDETLRAFDDLVRQGKVRYIGISNFCGWQIAESLWMAERHHAAAPVVMQTNYNLLSRDAEAEQLPALAHFGLSSFAFAPLAGGTLTGKYTVGAEPAAGSRGEFWADRPGNVARASSSPVRDERVLRQVAVLRDWAEERGHTAAQVALAWLLGNSQLTGVISGASTVRQLEESVGALEVELTADDRAAIAHIFGGH